MGAITGNRWWLPFKYGVKEFVIKFGRKFKLDKAKIAFPVEEGDSLGKDLGKRETEAQE